MSTPPVLNSDRDGKAERITRKPPWARILGYGLIAAGLLETFSINAFTLNEIGRARTNVPWWDEWALVQNLMQIDRGHALWSILWSPYWGERPVVTRLIWLANAHFRSLASLTWLTLLLQFVHIAVLIALARLLLVRTGHGDHASQTRSKAPFVVACVVIVNLMLSPFQMWNFVWSIQATFLLSFLVATTSFVSLALAENKDSISFVALAAVLAAFGTVTMPNGLLVWPVLVLQALYLKRSRRVISSLTLAGTVAFGSYLWHYTRPDIGMGVIGVIRHPIQTILLVGVVIAGPVGFISNAAAAVLGVLTVIATGYLSVCALRLKAPERSWLSALVAIILFLTLSSLSIVAGRLDPRFLGRDPLYSVPFRYPTMVSVLWTCIALLALHMCWRLQVRTALLAFYAVPLLYFMFATAQQQVVMAEDWSDYFRATDALGTALLLDVPDEELLSHVWPVRIEREERTAFLRNNHLAMFHEPRASWIGKGVADLFGPAGSARCIGGIEKMTNLQGFARVQGWAWDLKSGDSPDYILLTDAAGRIIGQARGGMRHGYLPGLLIEKGSVPASHSAFRHSEWLGYVRQIDNLPPGPISLFGVFGKQGKVCAVR